MAGIHKLICRLDFEKASFEVIDRPGRAMSLIDAMDIDWTELGENRNARQVIASYETKGDTFFQITLDPKSLIGHIESRDGIAVSALLGQRHFNQLAGAIDTLAKEFKFGSYSRFGFRIWHLCKSGDGFPSALRKFRVITSPNAVNAIEKIVGSSTDLGLSIDGEAEDKTKYHLRFGPFSPSESKKYFKPDISEALADSSTSNVIFDTDIYEENFSMKDVGFSRWCRSYIEKFDATAKSVQGLFDSTREGAA